MQVASFHLRPGFSGIIRGVYTKMFVLIYLLALECRTLLDSDEAVAIAELRILDLKSQHFEKSVPYFFARVTYSAHHRHNRLQ